MLPLRASYKSDREDARGVDLADQRFCGASDVQKGIVDGDRSDALTMLHVFGVEDVAVGFDSCYENECVVEVIAIAGSDLQRAS